MESSKHLHVRHPPTKSLLVTNWLHTILHCTAIFFLIYYRASFFFQHSETRTTTPLLPWILIFGAELILSSIWLLGRPFRFYPITRSVYPKRLPEQDRLPALDVFICTVDPDKEPTVEVMNTVLSAMALDYPANKIHVYLSDDGAAAVTLHGMKEAWRFARYWVPFRRKFEINSCCPKAYLLASEDDDHRNLRNPDYMAEKKIIQEKYEVFKESIMQYGENIGLGHNNGRDHPAQIEVIRSDETVEKDDEMMPLPLLVYVSREKRHSHPHHFKAGALNVLLRISGVMSNSPYILVLDCDMYCNDPTSAKQAMCFHLDSDISSSLSFVQFPQKFHNIGNHDIYDTGLRSIYEVKFPGLDALVGPILSGSCFYIKRESLYGNFRQKGNEIGELKTCFGLSNEFIKSLGQNYKGSWDWNFPESKILASCTYESCTKWGKEVGILYLSLVEDVFTGFMLHSKGWRSVYLDPLRPQFLGTGVTSLNELLSQGRRWTSGLVQVGLSTFCPLLSGPSTFSFLLPALTYTESFIFPLCYCFSLWCFATLPPLSLLYGTSLYPAVSNSFFLLFAFIFLSTHFESLYEVIIISGCSFHTWWYEQRLWMMKTVSTHTYGCLDVIMTKLGLREANFGITNKVDDDEKLKLYQMGKLDFQTSPMFLAPMIAIIILNLAAMVVGIIKISFIDGCCWDKSFVQIFLSFYVLTINCAITEAMVIRKDKGRIKPSVVLMSAVLSLIFLPFGYFLS